MSPVDMLTANAKALTVLPGIGVARAQQIIDLYEELATNGELFTYQH